LLFGVAGANICGYLHEPRHRVIEEFLVTFAKITFALPILIKRGPVFHASAATEGEVSANDAFVGEFFLGAGEGAFFPGGGELFDGRLEDTSQSPLRLYEEIAAEAVAGVLDDDVSVALLVECADGVFSREAVRKNRVEGSNAELLGALLVPSVEYSTEEVGVLTGGY